MHQTIESYNKCFDWNVSYCLMLQEMSTSVKLSPSFAPKKRDNISQIAKN